MCRLFTHGPWGPYSPDFTLSKRPTPSSKRSCKAVERTPYALWDKIGAQHEFLTHEVGREGRKRGAWTLSPFAAW